MSCSSWKGIFSRTLGRITQRHADMSGPLPCGVMSLVHMGVDSVLWYVHHYEVRAVRMVRNSESGSESMLNFKGFLALRRVGTGARVNKG